MSFSELLGNVGLFGAAVMLCLALLSIFSVGVIFDKQRRFRQATRQSLKFRPAFGKSIRAGEIQEAINAANLHGDSYVAQVVAAGLVDLALLVSRVMPRIDAGSRVALVRS